MEKEKKQWLGLLVIPLELLIGTYILPLIPGFQEPKISVLLTTGLFFLGFLVMILLFKDFLAAQWALYRQKLVRRLLITVLLVIGAVLLLQLVRNLLPAHLLMQTAEGTEEAGGSLSPAWVLFAAITPFIAPFAEELTFRYLLLGKISSKVLQIIMLFIQGILFGLIHLNNFNGNVYATIPYMVIGLYFGLIYLFFKNIWGSIMVHWVFNSINSILPAFLLFILSLFGVYTG